MMRPPYTRFALIIAIIWSVRNFIGINLVFLLLAILTPSPHEGTPRILAALIAVNTPVLLLWLLIVPRKRRARSKCSIIFLRGFKQEDRADVSNRVLPLIGLYGRIVRLANVHKNMKTSRNEILIDVLVDNIREGRSRRDWKDALQDALKEADLAVVDFSALSDNLSWEIEQCLLRMPATRIILIVEYSRQAERNYRTLCEKFPALSNIPPKIPVYPSRFRIPTEFWKWWCFSFQRRLHTRMKTIEIGNEV